jgi:hypothetical protein
MVRSGNCNHPDLQTCILLLSLADQTQVVVRTGLAIKIPDDMSYENAVDSVWPQSAVCRAYISSSTCLPHRSGTKGIPSVYIRGRHDGRHSGYSVCKDVSSRAVSPSGHSSHFDSSSLTVITTCSPHNFDLVRSRGADYVYDYKSPTAIADVQRAAGGDLSHILDCVGKGVSPEFCYKAMGPSGGKYSTFLFPQGENRKDIQASMVMAYNAYGSHFHKFGMDFPADADTYLRAYSVS